MSSSTKRSIPDVFRYVLTVLAAAYLLGRVAGYYLALGDVRRHHIESASFIFVAVLLASILSRRGSDLLPATGEADQARWRWAGFVVLAFSLYVPVIGVGLFADDFVLLQAAREGRWTVWTEFFRPVMFLVWRIVDALPGNIGPPLHILNIGLHALNASMVAILADRLGLGKWSAVSAGALFLTFPAAVEAVVWPAGIQDVLMASFVLGSLLTLTARRLTIGTAVLCVGLVVAASLTKETGVIAPVLALLTCVVMRAPRHRWVLAVVTLVVVTATLAVRFAIMPLSGSAIPAVSRYDLKELLVRPFATLAVPLRSSEATALSWLPVALGTSVVVLLVVASFRWNRASRDFHRVLFGAAFVLVVVAPVSASFFINDDLLGSRYLYLPAAGWSILLAATLPVSPDRSSGLLRASPGILLVACWFAMGSMHIQLWKAAAEHRDMALDAAAAAIPAGCREVVALGLPETTAGVPLFVNGFPQAMQLRVPGVSFSTAPAGIPAACQLTWTGTGFTRQ